MWSDRYPKVFDLATADDKDIDFLPYIRSLDEEVRFLLQVTFLPTTIVECLTLFLLRFSRILQTTLWTYRLCFLPL